MTGNSDKHSVVVYLFAVLAMILWSLSFIWSTIVFEYYRPVTTILIRLVISALLLQLLLFIARKREKINPRHYKLFLLSSLFNPFLYFLGENYGLMMTSPTISAVIIGLIPLFTPIAGFFFLGEKLSNLNIVGMVVSFLGILIMLVRPDLTFAASPLGVGLLFFAVIMAVFYSVLLRRLAASYSALTIIATQNLIGIFYFIPLFFMLDYEHFISVRPDTRVIFAILQLAVFASTAAYVLYTKATKILGISRTNAFTNLIPVFTAFFSWIIIGEEFGAAKLSGMMIVISGVALTQYKRSGKVDTKPDT